MTNKDSIRRHLALVSESLKDLEYRCDTEIVGEDSRHLLNDTQAALRVVATLDAENIKNDYDLYSLSVRLNRIYASIRVLKGTLRFIEKDMEKVSESMEAIERATEESAPDTDDESI